MSLAPPDVPIAEREVRSGDIRSRGSSRPRKAMTIGAVSKVLEQEFPDVSISKIRYLEDQKLLAPRRTPGGYRLYSQADVERLRTILRLQRDEFLPLRVIRQELAAGRMPDQPSVAIGSVRRAVSVGSKTAHQSLQEIVEETGVPEERVRELQEFGVLNPEGDRGAELYDETDCEIVRAFGELSRFGVAGRNLRAFRSSADRESAILEQIVGPSLRSRNPERRKEAVETLEGLAATVSRLQHLLLVRNLRRLTG